MRKLHLWNGIVSIVAAVACVSFLTMQFTTYASIGVGATVKLHESSLLLLLFSAPIFLAIFVLNILVIVFHYKSVNPTWSLVSGITGVVLAFFMLSFLAGIASLIFIFPKEEKTVKA